MHKIGILSDTHGLLRPEVIQALQGCEAILHGGDINRQDIIDQLNTIAPAYVVRGNNDKDWAEHIPMFLDFQLYGCRIYMTHKKKDLPQDLSDYDLVVYGHSHRYEQKSSGKTLLLNPGSCGPRRFGQAITMAVLTIPDSESEEAVKPSAIIVEKIEIPHESVSGAGRSSGITGRGQSMGTVIERKEQVSGDLIREIGADLEKHRTVSEIASRRKLSMELAEQIVRLYVTHPGVKPEQIMSKMGL